MEGINFFNSMDHLEPKCPSCKVKLEYGLNTKFDDKIKAEICVSCGATLE